MPVIPWRIFWIWFCQKVSWSIVKKNGIMKNNFVQSECENICKAKNTRMESLRGTK